MNCTDLHERLTPYLLGDTAPEDTELIRRHMDSCAACRATARELEQTLDLLRSGLAAAPAGAPARLDPERRRQLLEVNPSAATLLHTPGRPAAAARGWQLLTFRQLLPLAASLAVAGTILFVWLMTTPPRRGELVIPAAATEQAKGQAAASAPATVSPSAPLAAPMKAAQQAVAETDNADVAAPLGGALMDGAPRVANRALRADSKLGQAADRDAKVPGAVQNVLHDQFAAKDVNAAGPPVDSERQNLAGPVAVAAKPADTLAAADTVAKKQRTAKVSERQMAMQGAAVVGTDDGQLARGRAEANGRIFAGEPAVAVAAGLSIGGSGGAAGGDAPTRLANATVGNANAPRDEAGAAGAKAEALDDVREAPSLLKSGVLAMKADLVSTPAAISAPAAPVPLVVPMAPPAALPPSPTVRRTATAAADKRTEEKAAFDMAAAPAEAEVADALVASDQKENVKQVSIAALRALPEPAAPAAAAPMESAAALHEDALKTQGPPTITSALEFVNRFSYAYPAPAEARLGCWVQAAPSPVHRGATVFVIGIQAKAGEPGQSIGSHFRVTLELAPTPPPLVALAAKAKKVAAPAGLLADAVAAANLTRDDALPAGQALTLLAEVVLPADLPETVAYINVTYDDSLSRRPEKAAWLVTPAQVKASFAQADPRLQLATMASAFADLQRQPPPLRPAAYILVEKELARLAAEPSVVRDEAARLLPQVHVAAALTSQPAK